MLDGVGQVFRKELYDMDDIFDYMSIHEFSKMSGIEASTLRYWDEIGIFSPLRRNDENNYRYYSTAQLLALNFVTTLSDLEIPLRTIAELRHDRNPDKLLDLLEKQEKQMDMEMRRLRQRYSIIHARRELINIGTKADEGNITVGRLDNMTLILWPRNKYAQGDNFVQPLASIVPQIQSHHINLSFPVGGYYDNIESFKNSPECPDHFISLDPTGSFTRKAGDYLIGYVRGYYGDLGDLPDRMEAYAKEHSLTLAGPMYLMYLYDEFSTRDPAQYLAQASTLISTKKHKSGAGKGSEASPR